MKFEHRLRPARSPKVRIKFAATMDVKGMIAAYADSTTGSGSSLRRRSRRLTRSCATSARWTPLGFHRPQLPRLAAGAFPLSGGFEVWQGYSLSARPTQGGTHS